MTSGLEFRVTPATPVPAAERAKLIENPGFGKLFTDHMVTIEWSEGKGWHNAEVRARAPFSLDPAAAVLHYAQEIFEGMKAYRGRGMDDGTPKDIWQDVIASYLALADADAALAMWDRRGATENGETRTHTLYWLSSLKDMGRPDFTVRADAPLYAVFRDASGRRTYLAYNAGTAPRRVTFSDGKVVEVAPKSLVRAN